MTAALTGLLVLAALVWAFFMMRAMFAVLSLAPKGQRMRTYNRLSMWNFGQVRADIGPAVEPHLRAMRRGAYAFLVVLAAALAIAGTGMIATAMNTGSP